MCPSLQGLWGNYWCLLSEMNIANQVSMLRIIVLPVFAFFVLYPMPHHKTIAAVIFVLIAFSDYIDGFLARKYKLDSSSGRILDPLADKLLVITGFILLTGQGIPSWATVIVVLREIIITGLRSLSHGPEKSAFKASWPAKGKTVSQMAAVVVVLIGLPFAEYIVYLAVALSLYSGIEYLFRERKMLKEFLH